MGRIFNTPRYKTDNYGKVINTDKSPQDFDNLLGQQLSSIISFEDGTDELLEQGTIILPRHYHIFEGMVDGDVKFKPYETDKYRIVVSTYKGTIMKVEEVG